MSYFQCNLVKTFDINNITFSLINNLSKSEKNRKINFFIPRTRWSQWKINNFCGHVNLSFSPLMTARGKGSERWNFTWPVIIFCVWGGIRPYSVNNMAKHTVITAVFFWGVKWVWRDYLSKGWLPPIICLSSCSSSVIFPPPPPPPPSIPPFCCWLLGFLG